MDMLPVIFTENLELFLGKIDNEEISWTIFLGPFSNDIWIALITMALIIAGIITIVDRLFNLSTQKLFFFDYLLNLWVALKANIGGKPSSIKQNNTHKLVVFVCLLAGSLVWMAFRASLNAELSIIKQTFPFNDLDSLLKSDYRYLLLIIVLILCHKNQN